MPTIFDTTLIILLHLRDCMGGRLQLFEIERYDRKAAHSQVFYLKRKISGLRR
jgi:hypothetical protein